jgi:hypothetical protein
VKHNTCTRTLASCFESVYLGMQVGDWIVDDTKSTWGQQTVLLVMHLFSSLAPVHPDAHDFIPRTSGPERTPQVLVMARARFHVGGALPIDCRPADLSTRPVLVGGIAAVAPAGLLRAHVFRIRISRDAGVGFQWPTENNGSADRPCHESVLCSDRPCHLFHSNAHALDAFNFRTSWREHTTGISGGVHPHGGHGRSALLGRDAHHPRPVLQIATGGRLPKFANLGGVAAHVDDYHWFASWLPYVFEYVYRVMRWSDYCDFKKTMLLQTFPRREYVVVARSPAFGC